MIGELGADVSCGASTVRDKDRIAYKNKLEEKHVLDPRVAYLMTNLMEEVLRSGTAPGVRAE
jgi:membrane peptidoglycan carboxypeptidase